MSTYQDALDEHNPSNWTIISNDGTDLVAFNSKNNREFNGTTESFNEYVKLRIKPPVEKHYDIVTGIETGKILLRDPTVFYVRHDGCNGDGLHDTAESAFNSLSSMLNYIFNTYNFENGDHWFGYNDTLITIKMIGDWDDEWEQVIFPLSNYVTILIEFEDKYTNFISALFTAPAYMAEITLANVTLKDLSLSGAISVSLFSCVFVKSVRAWEQSWLTVGDCEVSAIPDNYGIVAAFDRGHIEFYNEVGDNIVTLKFTAPLGNNLMYAQGGSAYIDLLDLAFDLNGFTYTGKQYEVALGAQIYRPGDTTKSFLPGTPGIERQGGTYVF